MSENLAIFIRGWARHSFGASLLRIEPISFQNTEIKEILIRDEKGLWEWANETFPDTKFLLPRDVWAEKIFFLEIKIDNFSLLENGRLKVEDWIKGDEGWKLSVPDLSKVKEFSVFYQPSLAFGYAGISGDNKEVWINELVDFYSPDFTYPIKSIAFERSDEKLIKKIEEGCKTIPNHLLNPKKMAIKITVKGISNYHNLSFSLGCRNYESVSQLKIKSLKAENIEISAPFSRVENPNQTPQNPNPNPSKNPDPGQTPPSPNPDSPNDKIPKGPGNPNPDKKDPNGPGTPQNPGKDNPSKRPNNPPSKDKKTPHFSPPPTPQQEEEVKTELEEAKKSTDKDTILNTLKRIKKLLKSVLIQT